MYESWEWNQKHTIEVDTPDGVKIGSAVSHVWWREPSGLSGHYATDYAGEATVVEIRPGHRIFATIGGHTTKIAQYAFYQQLGISRADYRRLLPAIEAFRGKADAPRPFGKWVYFRDPNNPLSVQEAKPSDLPSIFGDKFRVKRVTLEITDEPITEGEIVKVLPWLATIGGGHMLDGDRYVTASAKHRLANDLQLSNFVRKPRVS